jgi:hypothetical protein
VTATPHAVLSVDFSGHDNLTICLFFRCNSMVLQAYFDCHGDYPKPPKNAYVRMYCQIVTQLRP